MRRSLQGFRFSFVSHGNERSLTEVWTVDSIGFSSVKSRTRPEAFDFLQTYLERNADRTPSNSIIAMISLVRGLNVLY